MTGLEKGPILVTGASGGIGGEVVRQLAAPILFLLSDAAAMITGVALPIDGGYTAV